MMLFKFDTLSMIMTLLTTTIGLVTLKFSIRYLNGDRLQKSFLTRLSLMIVSLISSFSSDNIFIFCCFWFISNALLVSLMIHKTKWQAAYQSGLLTARYLGFGFGCLAGALSILYYITGELSFSGLAAYQYENKWLFTVALVLLSTFIVVQSGLLPFHKWLTSSLNSPTPVSAIMHAGLVNGGGFVLIKFAPVYLQHQIILNLIFVFGMVSVLVGTLWKLIQNDVKKMLACSTISQMGFMICQCSIGMFAPAITHIILHGFFKANLFLHSPSSAMEEISKQRPFRFVDFVISILAAVLITGFFVAGFRGVSLCLDTSLVVISIFFIFASQFMLTTINISKASYLQSIIVSFVACIFSFVYGKTISLIERALPDLDAINNIGLNTLHWVFMGLLFLGWLAIAFKSKLKSSKLAAIIYIKMLNASLSDSKTITKNRNSYNF